MNLPSKQQQQLLQIADKMVSDLQSYLDDYESPEGGSFRYTQYLVDSYQPIREAVSEAIINHKEP